jgi:hypothetical protein
MELTRNTLLWGPGDHIVVADWMALFTYPSHNIRAISTIKLFINLGHKARQFFQLTNRSRKNYREHFNPHYKWFFKLKMMTSHPKQVSSSIA